MLRSVVAFALLESATLAGAADPGALATILEGKASLVRGMARYEIAQGTRLMADDLVRTDEATLLRIEWADGTTLDVGPASALQLNHPERRRGGAPALYLLAGWLKIHSTGGAAPARAGLLTPRVELTDIDGTAVVHADAGTALFMEDGSAQARERRGHGAPLALKHDNYLQVAPDKPVQKRERPAADFVAALPRPFRDPLPQRYGRLDGRPDTLQGRGAFAYGDVEPWINAEPALRRNFVALWRAKASEPAFREALEHDMASHPEWDPVLHPPPKAPAGADAAAAAH